MRTDFSRLLDTKRPYLALLALCALLWLPGFFTLPPTDRDEARFVQATKQMLETGDFITLRNGLVERNKKPVGIYWLQAPFAAAAQLAGIATENPVWPYRIPSFIGALLGCWMTFGLGAALVGRRAALLAAGMLASSILVMTEAHIAKTDAMLFASAVAALGLLARAWMTPDRFAPRHAVFFWLALGGAILLKGPVVPFIALMTVLWLGVFQREWRWLRVLRAAWGIPLMVLAVLPWFIAVSIATEGRFFQESVGQDLAGKLVQAAEQHWGPPGYYLLLLPVSFFPGALIVLHALPAAWATRRAREVAFLIAWVVPSWIVFEAVQTKLPHYVLPFYPALALFAARWALDAERKMPPRWFSVIVCALFVLGGVALALGGFAVPLLGAGKTALYLASLLVLLAAAAIVWYGLRLARGGQWTRAALTCTVLMVPLYVGVMQFVLPRTPAPWISPRLAAEVTRILGPRAPDDTRFGAAGYTEPSLMFLSGTGTQWLGDGTAAAQFLAGAPDRLVAVGNRDEAAFHAETARLGFAPREVGLVDGFNYSRGKRIAITLFMR